MEEDYIRLIFGLKLKQIRNEHALSLAALAKLTGLSKSYLNEIENGKKYPKPDKIVLLSQKLSVPYDQLVSLKLDKSLSPVGDILQSKILKEIPLDLFGVQEADLISIVAKSPNKVNTFISTLQRIAEKYNFKQKDFYAASLRSYQEENFNYFDAIENAVNDFVQTHQLDLTHFNHANILENILRDKLGYTLVEEQYNSSIKLRGIGAVFVPSLSTLVLSDKLSEAERNFIFAKELAYSFLHIKDKDLVHPSMEDNNFDRMLNDFKASYFAGALIIPSTKIKQQLNQLFAHESFDAMLFNDIINSFNASPEVFYQRLTSILPREFGIKELFFLGLSHQPGTETFTVTKELHFGQQQTPRAYAANENYCSRWVARKVLENLERSNAQHEFDLQISNFSEDDKTYLVISSATKEPFKDDFNAGFSIGLLINNQLKKKLNFLDDPKIRKQTVGLSCERCSIAHCSERRAAPTWLNSIEINQERKRLVASIQNKYKG